MMTWKASVQISVLLRIDHLSGLRQSFVKIFRVEIPLEADGAVGTGRAAIEAGNAKACSLLQNIHTWHSAFDGFLHVVENVLFGNLVGDQASAGTNFHANAALFAFPGVKE